jgi:hypothetical protein
VVRTELIDPRLVAGLGRPIAHREREAHGEVTGSALDGVDGAPMRIDERARGCRIPVEVLGLARREGAHEPTHQGKDVRLVDRARHADAVTERARGVLAEPGEALGGHGICPPSVGGGPARGREVVKRHHGHEPTLVAGVEHACVVVELRA